MEKTEFKIKHWTKKPTKTTLLLKEALEKLGVRVDIEFFDGHKHIDLTIPKAKLNIEIDGIQHLTNPHQIIADLDRGHFSHISGYSTMHIPNEMIHLHLEEIAKALAEASQLRWKRIYLHIK